MKILCGTNFDPGSEGAARLALDLAARTDGSVELLHVLPPIEPSPLMGGEVGAERAEELERRQTEQAIAAAAARLGAGASVPVTTRMEAGPPDACLALRAAQLPADLIVLGMSGKSRVERWLLGSVAERVVRLADRPVLLVPPPQTDGAPHRGGGGLKLLVALDEREESGGALAFVRHLRAQAPCDVVVLRLYWPVEEYRRLGLTGPRELFQSDPDVVRDIEASVRHRVGELPGAGAVEIAVEAAWGGRAEAIAAAARARGCDLLVMGAESRHGIARLTHPPVADRMARLSPQLPVVFVPAEAPAPHELAPLGTVLAATDFSEGGDLAARAAYGLLAGRGGVIELCHVHERPLASPQYAYDEPAGRLSAGERGALEDRLRALVPADAARHGITTHVTVIDGGRAATALVQAAERLRVDALVLGAGRSGATRHALLGSVAQTVARASRRPVILIPVPFADA